MQLMGNGTAIRIRTKKVEENYDLSLSKVTYPKLSKKTYPA